MFQTIFEATGTITTKSAVISLVVALVLGVFLSLVYVFSDKKKKYSQPFAFALVILPACVAAVIMLIGSDVARAISLGGVFALVRFRSVPGNSRDIVNVFFAMATGLACGMGCVVFAVIFCVTIGCVYFILNWIDFAAIKTEEKQLKITIPENLNYQNAFDDLFEEYTSKISLERVRTTNLGTLYELTYSVELKKDINEKLFLDSIRCRNGNLNITLCKKEEGVPTL